MILLPVESEDLPWFVHLCPELSCFWLKIDLLLHWECLVHRLTRLTGTLKDIEPCHSTPRATYWFTLFQLNLFHSTHMYVTLYFFTWLPSTVESKLLGAGTTLACVSGTDCQVHSPCLWITLECYTRIQSPCRKSLCQDVCSANLKDNVYFILVKHKQMNPEVVVLI